MRRPPAPVHDARRSGSARCVRCVASPAYPWGDTRKELALSRTLPQLSPLQRDAPPFPSLSLPPSSPLLSSPLHPNRNPNPAQVQQLGVPRSVHLFWAGRLSHIFVRPVRRVRDDVLACSQRCCAHRCAARTRVVYRLALALIARGKEGRGWGSGVRERARVCRCPYVLD